MRHDPWLTPWLSTIRDAIQGKPVLELGCGTGADTSTLVQAGFDVHAIDISSASVMATRLRVPQAKVFCQDLRDPFPLAATQAGAVLASLSLHYFNWSETLGLMQRIRATLPIGGLFLCRLNSTEDKNFGATGHPAIEPNYYLVDGQAKRFFDEASVDAAFGQGWKVLSKQHKITKKYLQSKALWEVIAQREA